MPDLPARLARFLDGRSPDLTRRDIRPSDRYLLCSDGLTAIGCAVIPPSTSSQSLRLVYLDAAPPVTRRCCEDTLLARQL